MAPQEHRHELFFGEIDEVLLRSERDAVVDAEIAIALRRVRHEAAEIGGGKALVDQGHRQELAQHRFHARRQYVTPGDPFDDDAFPPSEILLDLVQPGAHPHLTVLVAHHQHPHELLGREVGEAQVRLERSAVVRKIQVGIHDELLTNVELVPLVVDVGLEHGPFLEIRVDLEIEEGVRDVRRLFGWHVGHGNLGSLGPFPSPPVARVPHETHW